MSAGPVMEDLSRDGISIKTKEEYSRTQMLVAAHLFISEGRCYLVSEGGWYSSRQDDEIPVKRALKIANVLGVEEDIRAMLHAQALDLADKATKSRNQANDQHAAGHRSASDYDARAMRILHTLGVKYPSGSE